MHEQPKIFEEFAAWCKQNIAEQPSFSWPIKAERSEAVPRCPPSAGKALELKLAKEVIECDQERLRAQMSGLPTGWEHPNTQTYFKRVLRLAEMVLAQNEKGQR